MNAFNPAELARTLLEESGDALFLFDPETEALLEANPTAQRLNGYTRQELLRLPITYLFRAESQGGLQRLRHAYQRTGAFHSQEGFLLRHKQDGVWVPVNLTVSRLHAEPRTLGLITARDIRERRAAQALQKKIETELQQVLAASSVCLWSAEADALGNLVLRYVSPVAEKILGRPTEFFAAGTDCGTDCRSVLPAPWLAVTHTDDQERLRKSFTRALAGSLPEISEEFRILRPDGAARWVRDAIQIKRGADGRPVRIDGALTDITERKQAEEELIQSEQRFRALVEKSSDAFALLSADGGILYVSPSNAGILGYEPAELVGRVGFDFVHPEDLARVQKVLSECAAEPARIRTTELRSRHKNGSWRYIESVVTNRLDDPSVQAIVVNYRDITERRRAEDALRNSEEKCRFLTDSLEQCIILKDANLRFVAANRTFCQGLGLPEADILGKTDFDLYPENLAEKYRADDFAVLTQGKRIELEEQNLRNGELCTVRVVKTPAKDAEGRTTGVLGIFWDVTQQRQLEAQLRQAQKMEAVGLLAGGIAHDFNNLLTAILGNLSLMLNDLPDPHPARDLALAAERASLRAADLTSQLLGFSRRTLLRPQPADLNATVGEVVAILRRTIDPRIAVEVHAEPDLWTVKADPGQLCQVLMNLCINARDAMPDGGCLVLESANVLVTSAQARRHVQARPGDYVRLTVRDTGCGIAPEVQARIFEPFFTTKAPGKGTGLGLAMVFGIMQQHEGWIECHSEPSHGTIFSLFIPRLGEALLTPTPPPSTSAPVHGRETILLVDDEEMIRNVGRTILQRYGYEVLLAEDGLEAVEVYRREHERIDLVILDLTMPRLSGQDAFQQLREFDPEVRVLFASGYSADHLAAEDPDRVLGFVGKPYRPGELAQSVRSALEKARPAERAARERRRKRSLTNGHVPAGMHE